MLVQVVVEALLATGIWWASLSLWLLKKRSAFIKELLNNRTALEAVVTEETISQSAHTYADILASDGNSYALKLMALIIGERGLRRRAAMFPAILLGAFLLGSLWLGLTFFLINVILTLLTSFVSQVGEVWRAAAAEQVLAIAAVLDKWHREDANGCADWIEQAWSLKTLHGVVVNTPRT